jgi:hypothetical protein
VRGLLLAELARQSHCRWDWKDDPDNNPLLPPFPVGQPAVLPSDKLSNPLGLVYLDLNPAQEQVRGTRAR